MTTPRVYTYHCAFCSHLVFASTHTLASLPRRRSPGLDHAYIFPLPPPPPAKDDADDDADDPPGDKDSYTLLLTLARDRAPKIVARDDGFEKRVLWKCGRCRIVVAYQLDEIHYQMGPMTEIGGTVVVGGGEAGAGKDRARKEREREGKGVRWLYVLPGAVVVTEELGNEKGRVDVELGGA